MKNEECRMKNAEFVVASIRLTLVQAGELSLDVSLGNSNPSLGSSPEFKHLFIIGRTGGGCCRNHSEFLPVFVRGN